MNRRQRLMASIRGESVDRPPVSFYEINGLDERPEDNDPFNIFNHPSWRPLIELAREKSDRIVMRAVPFSGVIDPLQECSTVESWLDEQGRLFTKRSSASREAHPDQPHPARSTGKYHLDRRAPAEGRRRPESISKSADGWGAASSRRGRQAGDRRCAAGRSRLWATAGSS